MRIIFAGTPEFAAEHLRFLLAQGAHQIVAVYTQPDRPSGRGKQLMASPVKRLALMHDLPIYQPNSLKGEAEQAMLAGLHADLMVVVAYGLILPEAVLQAPVFGCINVHASLLPRWRGAAPIQRAIEAGDEVSGITIMQMDHGLDTGDILLQEPCAVGPDETAATLHDKLLSIGIPLLGEALSRLDAGNLVGHQQHHEAATYAHKITKAEARLEWSLNAEALDRKVRAFNPVPMAYFGMGDLNVRVWRASARKEEAASGEPGCLLKVDREGFDVATGQGVLRLHELQIPGKKKMSSLELINGYGDWFAPGRKLD